MKSVYDQILELREKLLKMKPKGIRYSFPTNEEKKKTNSKMRKHAKETGTVYAGELAGIHIFNNKIIK